MTVVLDSSAVLALLFDEEGAQVVARAVAGGDAAVGSVNLAEVATVLVRRGVDPRTGLEHLLALVDVVPFAADDAVATGELQPATARSGLSLGDRACPALGRRLAARVLTADTAWLGLDTGVEVEHLRPRG